jgi:hypothetical protein
MLSLVSESSPSLQTMRVSRKLSVTLFVLESLSRLTGLILHLRSLELFPQWSKECGVRCMRAVGQHRKLTKLHLLQTTGSAAECYAFCDMVRATKQLKCLRARVGRGVCAL